MKTFLTLWLLVILSACAVDEGPKDPAPTIDGTWSVEEMRAEDGAITRSENWLTIEGGKWSVGQLGGPKEEGSLTRQGNTISVKVGERSADLNIVELTDNHMVLNSTDGKFTARYKRVGAISRFRVQPQVPNPTPLFTPRER